LQALELDLNDFLSGTIPPSLSSLTSLQILGLCTTSLSGTIPPELGRLTNLQILGLCGTSLSRRDPAGVGQPEYLAVASPGLQPTQRVDPA
jgi:hypothetical protein